MKPVENALANYRALIGKSDDSREQQWLRDVRQQARLNFDQAGLPHKKLENWRYTTLDGLYKHEWEPSAAMEQTFGKEDLQAFMLTGFEAYRLVCVNGRFVPELSDVETLPSGMSVSWMEGVRVQQPDWLQSGLGAVVNATRSTANSPFADLNTALFSDGLFLYIEENVKIDRPIEILHITTGSEQAFAAFPRGYVALSAGAQAVVVERFAGACRSFYLNNGLNEVRLEENAKLEHYRIIEEGEKSYHMWNNYVQNGSGSDYRCVDYVIGGAWSRTEQHVHFTAPGANCDFAGLYVIGDNGFSDIHMDVRHDIEGCSSNQHYKGIVHGNGRAVFDGNIYVAKHAQKTDAHLKNANLMLSADAEIDTKPQLKIYADDVKCSHGATVGQLDYNQMYYLRSRGIPEIQARDMLCLSFVSEIVDYCRLEPVRNHVESRIQEGLPRLG